jgi:hypothetical protein
VPALHWATKNRDSNDLIVFENTVLIAILTMLGNLEGIMPKAPYHNTPLVLDGELTNYSPIEAEKLPVGSPAWFNWLENASRFAYRMPINTPDGAFITLTFRRESKQRGGLYWVAYAKDRAGKLHKVYAGKSNMLDSGRLEVVGQRMLKKLLSYPTQRIVAPKPRPARRKPVVYPPLTRAELAPFRVFTKMLDFCSTEFEKRWGRAWRWTGGKIALNPFDKNYYVWTADGSERQYLSHQRHFIIKRLLHWVNHGYDKGYDHTLPHL